MAWLDEQFENGELDGRLQWFCEPPVWRVDAEASRLVVEPAAESDFWQRTHYGFQADNGHFLYADAPGDFVLETRVTFEPAQQYDQAGLMVRLSADCWLKTSVGLSEKDLHDVAADQVVLIAKQSAAEEGILDDAAREAESRLQAFLNSLPQTGDAPVTYQVVARPPIGH